MKKLLIGISICIFVIFSISISITCAQKSTYKEHMQELSTYIDSIQKTNVILAGKIDSMHIIMQKYKYVFLRDSLAKVSGIVIPIYFADSCIDSVLKYSREYDIPLRLHIRLIYTESNFHHTARSWAGAYGLYQLMPATRASLINNDHCTKSDYQRGCFLLRKFKDNDGSWERVLAHYLTGNPNANARGYVNKILY